MNPFVLKRRQFIPKPLPEVFAFFERPENLAEITPPWLRFKIRTPSPIKMKTGAQIEYRIHPFFFPMKWVSHIQKYDPPHSFIDVQSHGPYKTWHHTHRFIEDKQGTWIYDEVRYALPFGWVGRLAHRLFVKRQLAQIFKYRAQVVHSRLVGDPTKK